MFVCVGQIFTLSNIQSNNSKCCPALTEACGAANAGSHAEPLYIYTYQVHTFASQISLNPIH